MPDRDLSRDKRGGCDPGGKIPDHGDVPQQCDDPFYHRRYADGVGIPVDLMADRKAPGGDKTDP